MTPSRPPRTPQLAEVTFEKVCLANGLTANRSHDDQFGWDFLLQFPSPRRGGPADLDPAGATCLAQVKSNRTSVAATSSNTGATITTTSTGPTVIACSANGRLFHPTRAANGTLWCELD